MVPHVGKPPEFVRRFDEAVVPDVLLFSSSEEEVSGESKIEVETGNLLC